MVLGCLGVLFFLYTGNENEFGCRKGIDGGKESAIVLTAAGGVRSLSLQHDTRFGTFCVLFLLPRF